jgi:diaminopimelate decarboxylase
MITLPSPTRRAKAGDCARDVVGPLSHNNDKFGVDRALPTPAIGDLAIIHDAGAHGSSMGFQNNGRLRAAEYLLLRTGREIDSPSRDGGRLLHYSSLGLISFS